MLYILVVPCPRQVISKEDIPAFFLVVSFNRLIFGDVRDLTTILQRNGELPHSDLCALLFEASGNTTVDRIIEVSFFKYLGMQISESGKLKEEINARMAYAGKCSLQQQFFNKKKSGNKNLNSSLPLDFRS